MCVRTYVGTLLFTVCSTHYLFDPSHTLKTRKAKRICVDKYYTHTVYERVGYIVLKFLWRGYHNHSNSCFLFFCITYHNSDIFQIITNSSYSSALRGLLAYLRTSFFGDIGQRTNRRFDRARNSDWQKRSLFHSFVVIYFSPSSSQENTI